MIGRPVALAEVPAGASQLWAALDNDFLTLLGWDPMVRVVTMPRDHPVLGSATCRVAECGKPVPERVGTGLCMACYARHRAGGLPLEEFVLIAKQNSRGLGLVPCSVPGCGRAQSTRRLALCGGHDALRKNLDVPLERFLVHPKAKPYPPTGPCSVLACYRERARPGSPYCGGHAHRLRLRLLENPDLDEARWRLTDGDITETEKISLRGLPDRVVAEVLLAFQGRTDLGIRTRDLDLRTLCDRLRLAQVEKCADLPVEGLPTPARVLIRAVVKHASRVGSSPETERHKLTWDLAAFGHTGSVRFDHIVQPWLRQAAMDWAFEDIVRRRGTHVAGTLRHRIKALALLSESLRLQRDDGGAHPVLLGREDIVAFCHRLAYLADQGKLSHRSRRDVVLHVRFVFIQMRSMGLAQTGRPVQGLPDDFAIIAGDVPDLPEDAEAGRDLPMEVMQHLIAHLPRLDETDVPEIRTAIELLMDTGRRPEEICRLPWDCLARDAEGRPVLVYDNHKANRLGRRLPITEPTAAVIAAQQQRARARFPQAKTSKLLLLPSRRNNRDGSRAIGDTALAQRHRAWVDSLPAVTVATEVEIDGRAVTRMLPFDPAKIFPYAYRHTYAQRHADAGVEVDVLRDLLNHTMIETTQRYYRVVESRRRAAVDRVTAMQFDRQGNRVWRAAKQLLDEEHVRRSIATVAVPFGMCTEPANVAAAGQDCPVRFRCVGCGHFRTDVSYLPDLEAYLSDLLRNRERLAAMTAADAWARAEAMPSDEEISRVKRLISLIKDAVGELPPEDRAQIADAVAVVRRHRRATVPLGMPRVGLPLDDTRTERPA